MKITIFTSNSFRHLSLVNKISKISNECNAIIEVKTVFPGSNKDFFDKSSEIKKYFKKVDKAERHYFKNHNYLTNFTSTNVKMIKQGDLNNLSKKDIEFAINSDIYIVFGSSFITNKWLINFLIKNKAINIHMGLSPFYRGSSCNFWAINDGKPEYVGATIHYLSKGLDSGKIIAHCLPNYKDKNIFNYTMSSVKTAQNCLISLIKSKKIFKIKALAQDKKLEIRYSTKKEFTNNVIKRFFKKGNFIKRTISNKIIDRRLINTHNFSK